MKFVKHFLAYPNTDFYSEVKTKTAFALRNYNFDLEVLPKLMKDMREIKSDEEIDLLKKAVAISCSASWAGIFSKTILANLAILSFGYSMPR